MLLIGQVGPPHYCVNAINLSLDLCVLLLVIEIFFFLLQSVLFSVS